ncbi:MAG: carboxypeptidase regulatory-like domain-containing protein [Gemmatimonadota bacterium]|nr:carboxypeptidase regulatory-like domain-containing protein [Gemmatimonadota bacterium]
MTGRLALRLCAAAALVPTAGPAQVIAGRVLEPTGGPVGGAVVVLVDTSGNRISSAVATLTGAYKVDVGGAGTFWLRVTSPKHAPSVSPAFVVEAGEEVSYDHTVPTPIALASLEQRGRSCPTSAPRGGFVGAPPARVKVVDEATGAGVRNAIVALLDSAGTVRAAAASDSGGNAALGLRPEPGDLVCVRKLGMPLTTRPALEAPAEGGLPWLVLVRAPARELTPVEVRATRLERMKDLNVPNTARFFGVEEFAPYVPAALNFGDLLRPMNAPGVSMKSANGRVNCVMLRGTTCVPTLLDNIPSNTVYDLDPFMIEGIAILNPTDAYQRFGALGQQGLVLIYTKRNLPKRAERKP